MGVETQLGENLYVCKRMGQNLNLNWLKKKSLCKIVVDYPLIDMGFFLWLNNDMFGYGT